MLRLFIIAVNTYVLKNPHKNIFNDLREKGSGREREREREGRGRNINVRGNDGLVVSHRRLNQVSNPQPLG